MNFNSFDCAILRTVMQIFLWIKPVWKMIFSITPKKMAGIAAGIVVNIIITV